MGRRPSLSCCHLLLICFAMARVYATTGFGEVPGEAFAYDLRIAGGSPSLLPALDSYLQGTGGQAESGAASVGGDGSMPMWLAATPSGKLAYTVDMSGEGSVHAHHVSASGALTPINVQPSLGAGP